MIHYQSIWDSLKITKFTHGCYAIGFHNYVNSILHLSLFHPSQQSSPWGSTSLATLRASELAKSVLAGVTARIRQLSLVMNCKIMSRIWCSMSTGWSPTATLVIPGKSMRVRFNTVEEREREREHFNNGCRDYDYEYGLRKAVVLGSLVLYYRVESTPWGWWE